MTRALNQSVFCCRDAVRSEGSLKRTDELDLHRRFMVSCCNCLRLLMDLATRSRLIGKSQLHIAGVHHCQALLAPEKPVPFTRTKA